MRGRGSGWPSGLLTKGFAVASEEADKRSWRTLPDEIHLARAWVSPGEYRVQGAVAEKVLDAEARSSEKTFRFAQGKRPCSFNG